MSMKNTILTYIDRFRHDHRQRLMLGSVLLVLAVLVTMVVYWQLRYTGITMTNETYCGYEEHTHTDECYEYTLICGLEESEGHTHTDECYEEQQVLVCGLEESEGHTHTEACYDEEGNLICGLEESEGHTHTDACYETQKVLVCGLEESEGHTHTEECYEQTLICELEEHTHTAECMVDETADIEDATIWEATLPELTGDLRTDIVNIAYSQLGYVESTANYTLGDDGITHMGYTRYGTWYGSSYSDWDSIFVAFCLEYAGVADEFTYNAGAYAWTVDLANSGYYQTADVYAPSVGDVVFIDTNADGKADVSAIVVSIDETLSTITVIQGNYTTTNLEGVTTDSVACVIYSTVPETAVESEIVAVSAESETTTDEITETEVEEITPVILGYANVAFEVASDEITDETATDEDSDEEVVLDDETLTDEESSEWIIEDETTDSSEDEALGSSAVLTYFGEDYIITVTYGEDALLPEGTYLEAYEYSSDSETYLLRYAESAALYGWEGEPTDDFRVFNIGLYCDGVEIEPAAEIQVSITYTATENADSVSVTHHDDTAEPLYAVSEYSEETGTETVTFTADGFSDYSIMATSTDGDNNLTASSVTNDLAQEADVVWSYNSVTYDDGSFDVSFHVDFTNLPVSTITTDNYTFYLSLPDGVTVPSTLVGTYYTGYDNDGNAAFKYSFVQASDSTWQIEIIFDESYVANASDTLVDGYVNFSGTYTLQDKNAGDTSEIKIYSGDEVVLIINGEDVSTEDNENWLSDISVEKSGSGYDKTTNSITYTIVISSENGTQNEINLSDAISFIDNSTYSGTDLSVKSITIDSVTYYANYYNNGYYNDGSSVSYTSSTSSTGVTITLPALSGTSGSTEQYTTTNGDCYVIVYTVKFSTPSSGEYSTSINNTATVTTDTDAGEIEDDSEVTKNAINSALAKSGAYDSSTGTIEWTISFNSSNGEIAGYTLYDNQVDGTSFADAVGNIDVAGGTEGVDYEYVYDTSTGELIGITFLAVSDTDGDGIADSNIYSYNIIYTTDATTYLGSSGYTARNIVTTEDEDDTEQGTQYGDVYVDAGGSLHKELTDSADSTITLSDGTVTRILSWKTIVTVTAGGIKSGTVFEDYLGTSGKDYSSYTSTDTTDQWFTYSQITELFGSLATNGITIGSNTISYSNGANFTLQAYDATTRAWVSYSAMASSAYSNDLFTAYKITFNNDYDYNGTWTLTYSTTADISDVEDKTVTYETYYNSSKIGSLESYDSYTENSKVYKTDGNDKSGTTSASLDDNGTITWKVHVYVESGSTESFTVTDKLPAGLTFDSATVMINWDKATLSDDDGDGNMTANFGWITQTAIEGSVSGDSTTGTTVVVTVLPDHYAAIASSSSEITITYTVHITDFDSSSYETGTTYDLGSYTNGVSVKYGNDDYGEDEQTQEVEYTKTDSGSTGDSGHDAVEKDGEYKTDNTLRYQVLVNLDAEELNGGSALTLTDVATVYYSGSGSGWNNALLSLINSSVTIYHLNEITVDDSTGEGTYVDLSGKTHTISDVTSNSNVYTYAESDGSYSYYYKIEDPSIGWTYSETDDGYGHYYYTITVSVPDSTAILVEYQYTVTGIEGGGFTVDNSATLTSESSTTDQDSNQESDTWHNSETSGGVTSGSGITIYKVEADNYGTAVPNAKFELYKYDTTAGKWVQVTYDDFQYGYNVSTGDYAVNSGDSIMDSDDYLITNANGIISLSNTFSYTDGTDTLYAYYSWYEEETLYYIVEIAAPTGYELITRGKTYFYWADKDDTTTYVCPSDVDQYNTTIYNLNATSINQSVYVENQPNTSFTLKKVSSTDTSLALAGATYALYEFHDDSTVTAEAGTWVQIGTYVTDSKGEITITFNDQIYKFNHAYKLVEISSPEGYNIGYNDRETAEVFFYWSSSDYTLYPPVLPSDWASGTTGKYPYEALDIATTNGSVEATNTKLTTTVAVKKLWVDEQGRDISASGAAYSATATVKLYYYLSTSSSGSASSSSSSSSTDIITLSTYSSDTTSVLFTRTLSTTLLGDQWTSGFMGGDVASFASAVFNTAYSDGYVEITVQGGSNPSAMRLIFQKNNSGSYDAIATVSPTKVTLVTTDDPSVYYYTVQYSISSIRTALGSYGQSDIDSICIDATSLGTQGEMLSISVEGDADYAVTSSTVNTTLDSSSSWISTYYQVSSAASALQEDGAVIAVTYSDATSGVVRVGIQFSDGTAYHKEVTVSDTSGTIYVLVSDMTTDAGDSISGADWDEYLQTYVQYESWSSSDKFTGTIKTISILIPAASTSVTTYNVVATATDPTWSTGTADLTSDWTTYLTGDTNVMSALTTDGAIIYIEYECTEAPSSAIVGLQYTTNGYSDVESISIVTRYSAGSGTIEVPVSSVYSGTFDADTYNAIYLSVGSSDAGKVTITSVSVLVPYTAEAGISPSVDSSVTLYNPTLSVSLTGNYSYNDISKLENEPDIDATVVDSEYSTTFTGYGFLNAVYSESATAVQITLSNVSDASLLSKLGLVIQGDLSVGYEAICYVTPTDVSSEGSSYILTYSTDEIKSVLATQTNGYTTASAVYADYNAVYLQLASDSAFSATLTDFKVVGSVSDYYALGDLVGYYSGGQPYSTTDDAGNVTYYTYTLSNSNDWSVAVSNLPRTCTDSNGDTQYYCYYFVETDSTGIDTNTYTVSTTYSQAEGENGGGEIVVVNTLIETTSVTVQKQWVDQSGNDVSDSSAVKDGTVTVKLYYYLDSGSNSSNAITGVTYSQSDLVGEGKSSVYYGTYTLDYDDNWSYTVYNLPKYTVQGTTVYNRYYYFVETETTVTDIDLTAAQYSQADGITSGTITIYNTTSEDSEGYLLPSTGGQSERIYVFAGLMLILLAFAVGAYRNIKLIRFSATGDEVIERNPSKHSNVSDTKPLAKQKKFNKDRNGDSRAGPKN